MARTTPKSSHLKAVAGTVQPCREAQEAFQVSDGQPSLPPDFEDLKTTQPVVAKRVLRTWNGYLEIFQRRGQAAADFEAALYSLCTLEVRIRMLEETNKDVPMAMVNGHRVYLNEFHLTPAGNIKPAGTPAGNKFKNNGRPQKP